MFLKQLKQLTLSATRRNAGLARFYGSPAVCQSLETSKVSKRLSRDDRRALVESFVNEYRATNAGKFPTLKATLKEVGGGYYMVRDIFQELKLNPKAPVSIAAKALSEVSASAPVDASTQTVNEPQSQSSACNAVDPVPIVAKTFSEVSASAPIDASSQTVNEPPPQSFDSNAEHFSPVVSDPDFQAGSPGTIKTGSDQRQTTIDSSHPMSDGSIIQGNNLVITEPHDKRERETAPENDVDSKWGSNTHLPESQKRIVLEERLRNTEIEEEETLTHLGSQESKGDHLEGAAVSANGVPTETRQLIETEAGEVKTEEKSSAWSNIMSFAKEFANIWRKG